jgi:hypothetical protein
MKLLDLIDVHQDGDGVLWMIRSGENAGMTSLVSTPRCWSFTIKDKRLSVQVLEQILYEAVAGRILVPSGGSRSIHSEDFLKLEVEITEFVEIRLVNSRPDMDHG